MTIERDSRQRSRYRLGALGLFLALVLAATGVGQPFVGLNARADDSDVPASDALAADIALISEQLGLDLDEVASFIEFQESFAKYAAGVIDRYPGQVAGIWTDEVPTAHGTIGFVGEVPADLEPSPGINVTVVGAAPLSVDENRARARVAFDALFELDLDIVTFYSQDEDMIHVEIRVPSDGDVLLEADLLEAIQAFADRRKDGALSDPSALTGRAAEFLLSDVKFTVMEGDEPRITPYAPKGGTWLRVNGQRLCTGAFSVKKGASEGVMTAGHCTGLNQLEEIFGGPIWAMTLQAQSFGQGGDSEWHTTTGNEVDDFHAGPIELRDVVAVRATGTMQGNLVCAYGRASNFRSCDHTVEAVFVNIILSGQPVGGVARASNDSGAGGDSGGPWFMGNVAWGHLCCGDGGSTDVYFTTAREAESQLGVTIQTQ